MKTKARKAQIAGLNAFARLQKEESRRRLIEAAERVFDRNGYIASTIDDIAQEAEVSRQTFYRHFDGKLAIAMEYFERTNAVSQPMWTCVGKADYWDRDVVIAWITSLFDHYETRRRSLRTFIEMGTNEPVFVERIQNLIPEIIEELGQLIPAFRARGRTAAARGRWVKAWLFLFHLREQCTMNATGFMAKDRPVVIAAYTDAFFQFLEVNTPSSQI